MGISIVNLERDQYFFVRDRCSEECLENAYSLADSLTEHENRKSKTQERIRRKLKDNLSDVLGYRRGEDVAELDVEDIFEILKEEAIRRREFRTVHLKLYQAARDNAKRKFSNWEGYSEGELKIDGIYHTTERSGIGRISEMLDGPGGMEVTERLYAGERLLDVVGRQVISVMKVLPAAMFFAESRKKLCAMLGEYGLNEKQITEIMRIVPYDRKVDETATELSECLDLDKEELKKALEKYLHSKGRFDKRFEAFAGLDLRGERLRKARKIVIDSLRRGSKKAVYAKAVRQLLTGDLDLDYVLGGDYKVLDWYPLVGIMQDLDLRDLPVHNFHTNVAKDVCYLVKEKYSGRTGMPKELLKFLQNLAEMEVEVSRWSSYGGNSVLYPKMEIDSSTLGNLFGLICLGHGIFEKKEDPDGRKQLVYMCSKRGINSTLQYLEQIGMLRESPYVEKSSPDCLRINLPFHYHDLVTQIPPQEFNREEFARCALSRWLEDRGVRPSGNRGGYYGYIRLWYEKDMRRLANRIGLYVSEGRFVEPGRRSKLVYTRNPNILGFGL